jgi:hypothetical protein
MSFFCRKKKCRTQVKNKREMAGLAKQLRMATDNEDVDLGGYGESQISDLFAAAFKEPIVASKMIGFRFTVGGGKKVRQKYGEDMPKWCR